MTGYILTLTCADRIGIVAAVTSSLADMAFNIDTSHQHSDQGTGRFFMRTAFSGVAEKLDELRARLGSVAKAFAMDWRIYDLAQKPRVLLMVSKFGHCLNDLLYRLSIEALNVEIPCVVSNHTDFQSLTASHRIPFVHLPVDDATKREREADLLKIIRERRIELVVLARYMQVLSPDLCKSLSGMAINIHHSFLPSFKGAKPYQQAYTRGVKLIGATAHYVTTDLDEGPIIEQEVSRVDHGLSAEDFIGVGRDVESVVLARAVRAHIERRVFINGQKTIVFR